MGVVVAKFFQFVSLFGIEEFPAVFKLDVEPPADAGTK